jgi:glycosyltransferase involved in cell wall biosynthesis
MKVVMLVLNPFTHDTRVHKEASTLAGAGYDVRVLALCKGDVPAYEERSGYRIQRLQLASLRHQGGRLAPARKYYEWMQQVAAVTAKEPAHVYHAHDANTLISAYRPVTRDGARWVYDAHELETGRNFQGSHLAGIYRNFWAMPEKLLIRRVDRVITVNQSIADLLAKTYAIAAPTVIMNAPPYSRPAKSKRLHEELGIPTDQRIVLYQGAVSAGRGVDVALRSLLELPENIAFVALGDGNARQALIGLAEELGLAARAYFPGYMPLAELLDYTVSADVGLAPFQKTSLNNYYALPNKLFEYAMVGLPVVASDFPEMRRVVTTFEVGELVHDPTSPAEFAAAIRRIFADPARYAALQDNARRLAEEFNWEHEAHRLLALYAELEAPP